MNTNDKNTINNRMPYENVRIHCSLTRWWIHFIDVYKL